MSGLNIIVENHLKKNNFNGLFNREGECACEIGDLEPCDGFCLSLCTPGYTQVEKRDGGFVIGEYHPKFCPNCKTKRDCGPLGFKLSCPKCGHDAQNKI